MQGGTGKSTDTRRYDVAMLYYIFFFFLRLLLYLKFKPLLRCAYVRYFNLCPKSLNVKTGQFASIVGMDWEEREGEGRGERGGWEGWEGCGEGVGEIISPILVFVL